jgi:multiple RNA-binding domain-containing protein 1
LLKNLPAGSTVATIQSLLESVNGTVRILVPPSGTLALVELGDPATATKAATSLAYRKLGNSVIYVERAPSSLWKDLGNSYDTSRTDTLDLPSSRSGATPSESNTQSHSLFVTKLPPTTSAATLKSLFQSLPGFTYANLIHRPTNGDTSRGGPLSGFVGFASSEDAERAKKAMNGHVVDGHMLSIAESKSVPRDASLDAKQSSGKLLIKNLPFETNKQELRDVLRYP